MTHYVQLRVGLCSDVEDIEHLINRYSTGFQKEVFCDCKAHYTTFVRDPSGSYNISVNGIDLEEIDGVAFNLMLQVAGPNATKVGEIIQELAAKMKVEIMLPPKKLQDRIAALLGIPPTLRSVH